MSTQETNLKTNRFVELEDLLEESLRSIAEYTTRLRSGIYHVKSFMVFGYPQVTTLTAFLDCIEGKFKTASPLIVNDLMGRVGHVITKALADPNIHSVKVEVVPYSVESGRIYGVAFRYGKINKPTNKLVKEHDASPEMPQTNTESTLPLENTEHELRAQYSELLQRYEKTTDSIEKEQINSKMVEIIRKLNLLYPEGTL